LRFRLSLARRLIVAIRPVDTSQVHNRHGDALAVTNVLNQFSAGKPKRRPENIMPSQHL
jgi:hypothetical protein